MMSGNREGMKAQVAHGANIAFCPSPRKPQLLNFRGQVKVDHFPCVIFIPGAVKHHVMVTDIAMENPAFEQ